MSAAWLAMAVAVLCWPAGPEPRRVRELAASRRLAAPESPASPDGRSGALRAAHDASAAFTGAVLGRGWVRRAVAAGMGLVAAAGLSSWGAPAAIAAGVATAVAVGTGLALLRGAGARRRRAQREAAIALALAVIVGELEAGASPAVALQATASSIGQEIAEAVADGVRGVGGATAFDPLERVVAAWRVSTTTGVALTDVLARVRADLAASADARREVGVTVAGPRSSAVLLALLPVLGVGLGIAMGADPVRVLLATQAGRLLLCAGVVLDAVGLLWTDALVARAQR